MDALSDEMLVQRCLRGETRAFASLVDRHQVVLYNLALRMVKNRQDAEDITQTVFIKAFEKLESFNPRYKFFSWIYRMAVNESLNFIKKRKSYETLVPDLPATGPIPSEQYIRDDVSERVGVALMDLTPEDRALIILKHIQNFSYRDIAYIFDISQKTVKSRLYSARQRLKEVLIKKGLLDR